jgi:membrane protease subunit (stomatin/prohibitin family)
MDAPLIARPASAKGHILFRWPDPTIRKLTQLTVEQDDLAIFFRDGRVQRTIPPGRVTLDASETPTELYFVSTREFRNLPFGGAIDKVVDPETSVDVGLRVFGEYSLKVIEPESLIVNLVGSQNLLTNGKITDWTRGQLLKTLRTEVVAHIVTKGWPLLGIAAHTEEIESETIARVQHNINGFGLQIVRLGNFAISLTPEDGDRLISLRTQNHKRVV